MPPQIKTLKKRNLKMFWLSSELQTSSNRIQTGQFWFSMPLPNTLYMTMCVRNKWGKKYLKCKTKINLQDISSKFFFYFLFNSYI